MHVKKLYVLQNTKTENKTNCEVSYNNVNRNKLQSFGGVQF